MGFVIGLAIGGWIVYLCRNAIVKRGVDKYDKHLDR